MTPQEVIQRFMAELNANNYDYDTSNVGKLILDAAVRSSSKFTDTQDVIDQMFADQTEAEKLAVEEVLGSAYAGKTLSQVSSSIRSASALDSDAYKKSNIYIGDGYAYSSYGLTVEKVIQERKAIIFLRDYCGIQLEKNFWISNSGVTFWGTDSGTGNVDTGAITGSDANITLTAGDVVNGSTLTSANLKSLATKYGTSASLSGDTLVIGTGIEKTATSIVPEEGDMYLFSASGSAKNINTGSNGWVVNATSGNDTITSGGRDSINAGNGSDKIIANADESTITTGNGNDTVEISATVKSVMITDLNSSDTISIGGTFEVGNAQIENSTLVVTDKTGTRKIRFSDLTNVGNANIGAQKISEWLGNAGFSLSDLTSSDTSSDDVSSSDVFDDAGRVAIDPNYTPNIDIANRDSTPQTQTISSAANINLDDVTISSGTVKAGSSTVGTVSTVTPAVMNFTTRGLTIHVGDGTSTSYNQLSAAQKMMVAALFKWWAGEALNLNEESYNIGFESDTAKVTDITLNFKSIGGTTLALVSSSYRGDHQTDQLELQINTNYYNTFIAGDTNGTSTVSGAGFLDRTLAHEFTHAVMSTNINNFATLPQFITEGMAELTHGIDDERGNEIFALAYDASSLSSALSFNSGTGTTIAYSGGFMFLRYFARQAALQTLTDDFAPGDITATVNLGTGNATYYVSGNSTLETATTSKQDVSLGSSSGSTYTVGNTAVNQMISIGSGARKIVGVTHNTGVKGGAGSDTIQFVEGTLIDAGNGNNSIVGSGQFATITAGTGNDSVLVKGSANSIALGDGKNFASIGSESTYDNTITTGSGNDTVIANMSYNSHINAGDGDNVISIGARNSTIQTGDGADSLTFLYGNDSGNVISLGAGNDTVGALSTNNTIDMGAGDDYVAQSDGNNVFLYNAESGNDTIWFFRDSDKLVIAGDYATEKTYTYNGYPYIDVRVDFKSGDSVTGSVLLKQASSSFTAAANIATVEIADDSDENSSLVTGTDGNDSINNTLDGATILALAGNDSIVNSGKNVSIDGGAGDDSITNSNYYSFLSHMGFNVTINGGSGNDSISNYSDSVTIDAGDGKDFISNGTIRVYVDNEPAIVGSNVSINGGNGDDSIRNFSASVTINGGDGNDSIKNGDESDDGGNNVTISGGSGDDSIINSGDYISINGGIGNDEIENLGDNVTIDSGNGNNLIVTRGNNVSVSAGDGNDTIINYSDSITIDAGTGNDQISLGSDAENNLIRYTEGDGNDTITGLNAMSTLQIGGGKGTYSTAQSGNDIIVTVGDGSILLKGAASLESVNISGVEKDTEPDLLIIGTDGDDEINNTLDGATIQALAGNDSIRNTGASVSIDAGAGNDTILNSGSNVTLEGGSGNDYIGHSTGSNVSIKLGAGDDTISINGASVTIDGGDGDDLIWNFGSNSVSIDGGAGNDTISNSGDNVVFEYSSGDGNDTITGFNATSTLQIGGGKGTYSTAQSGDDIIVTVGDGSILLKGAASLESVNISGVEKDTEPDLLIIGTDGDDEINNTLDGATIQALGGNDTIFNSGKNVSIDGGDGDDSIISTGDSVTIDGGRGSNFLYNTGSNVSISGGDGNDSIINTGTNVSISGGTGNATIINNGSDSVTIDGGSGDNFLYNSDGSNVSISGGDGNDSICNVGDNVSITAGDGDDSIENYSDSVTIDGGNGGDEIYNEGNHVSISGGDGSDVLGNLGTESTIDMGAGNDYIYNAGDDVTITAGDGSDTIEVDENVTSFTVTDFGAGDVIRLNASVDSIAVENNSLIAGGVTIGGINKLGGEEFIWTVDNGNATYTKKTSSGATLSDDGKTITFTNKDASETLFTLTGLNPDLTADDLSAGINISDGKIILSASVLNQKTVRLTTSGNYALALGEDCPTVTAVDKSWTLDGTTATYHDAGKTEGYKLTSSKIVTHSAATGNKTLLTVTGLADGLEVVDGAIDGLSVDGKTLTVTPDVVGENISISSGYKIVFDAGEYAGSKFTGNTGKDTIEVNGSGLEIEGGKGNDTITARNGGNVYLFAANGGKDVIVGYGDDDTIKITDDSKVTASVKGSDVIIKAGTATMTLKNAATGKQISVVDSSDETLIDEIFYADRIVKDNGATLTAAFNSKSFAADETIRAVDGSASAKKFSLTGGDEDNTLIGGTGANFLNGGEGDNILTGGKGNDTFVAGNGNDTITDYGVGTDKISLTADVEDFKVEGSDVILSFGEDKTLTIQNGVDKKINFLKNGKTSTEIFTSGGKTNTAGTSITLAASTDSYTAPKAMLTIDGGLTDDVWIVGNAKSNKILGGDGNDTLFGGTKNDTLTGGGGSDIFIFETGRDVITDYVSGEDTISLAASPTSETLNSKGDVILKFGTNSLTIKNVGGQAITFADDTTKIYYSERIVGEDGVTLQSTFGNATFAATDELPKVDGSASAKKFTLTGGDESNTLIGGKGVNLLNGGKGNDLLIGGGGADTFVYSSGDDTIGDYETKDRISLSSAVKDFSLENDDVIISFDEGSLTIKDAAGKSVTFLETVNGKITTQVNVFAKDGIFNTAKTAATLAADTSTFNAASYSKLVTIDGGLATDAISIVGNGKNNVIIAGDNGSTLNGGKGNDSLWGGDGSDTFIHESGKDVVYGFGNEDALQFSGNFTASINKDNSIAFKVGSTANAITLKDYTATSFNINGNTYTIDTLTKK